VTQLTFQLPMGFRGGKRWSWHSSVNFGRIGWSQCAFASLARPLFYHHHAS
jgi:hypothetical protein